MKWNKNDWIGALFSLSLFLLFFSGCSQDELPDLKPSPLQATAFVFGSVFHADEGRFVAGAEVQVLPGFESTTTDENGNFFLEEVQRGEFQVRAQAGNYIASSFINTKTTDVLSVELTFGTTARNPQDISFKENQIYVTKKVEDVLPTNFYQELIASTGRTFQQFGKMDWSPTTPDELIFAGREPASRMAIYRFNLSSLQLVQIKSDPVFACTDPTYSPNGQRFAFLRNGQVFMADLVDGTNELQLIRDGALTFFNLNDTTKVLNLQLRNEQINAATGTNTLPERLPSTKTFPAALDLSGLGLGGISSPNIQNAANFRSQLNRYFNRFCTNVGNIAACLNSFDQFCNSTSKVPGTTTINGQAANCQLVFDQGTPQSQPFSALNFPAACPVEMSEPVWSRTGNQIAFLARPTGCSAQRPRICGRTCTNSDWEVFLGAADVAFSKADLSDKLAGNNEFLLDKYAAYQVTNNTLQETNIALDPGRQGSVLFDQITIDPQTNQNRHFLIRASPVNFGFRSYIVFRESPLAHNVDISSDGKQILWIDNRNTGSNRFGFPQVFMGEWSGIVRNDRPVTRYETQIDLSNPKFYKLRPRAF